MHHPNSALSEALDDTEGVLTSAAALRHMSEDQLRWKIASGRWQKPVRASLSPSRGPSRPATAPGHLLTAGPAVLAGLTAARLDGLSGFNDKGRESRPSDLPARALWPPS